MRSIKWYALLPVLRGLQGVAWVTSTLAVASVIYLAVAAAVAVVSDADVEPAIALTVGSISVGLFALCFVGIHAIGAMAARDKVKMMTKRQSVIYQEIYGDRG